MPHRRAQGSRRRGNAQAPLDVCEPEEVTQTRPFAGQTDRHPEQKCSAALTAKRPPQRKRQGRSGARILSFPKITLEGLTRKDHSIARAGAGGAFDGSAGLRSGAGMSDGWGRCAGGIGRPVRSNELPLP